MHRQLFFLLFLSHIYLTAGICERYSSQAGCTRYPAVVSPLPNCGAIHIHNNNANADSNPAVDAINTNPVGGVNAATNAATTFAIVGDFGLNQGDCLARTTELVSALEAQLGRFAFVLSLGDAAYYDGNCGAYEAMYPFFKDYFPAPKSCKDEEPNVFAPAEQFPTPRFGQLNSSIRFFPTMGNHDFDIPAAKNLSNIPYFQYFPYILSLPGASESGGHYYTYNPHPLIQVVSLNSNLGRLGTRNYLFFELHERMLQWARTTLLESTALYKFVIFHHPIYSTAQHDFPASWMHANWGDWGATAVFYGHQHAYERIQFTDIVQQNLPPIYVQQGLSGHAWIYDNQDCAAIPGSRIRYNAFHGVLIGQIRGEPRSDNSTSTAENSSLGNNPVIDMCFYSMEDGGKLIDHFQLHPEHPNPLFDA